MEHSTASVSKKLFLLATPIILANLFQSAYQLTDAFWIGKLGEKAVAAISISFPITFLLIALGGGFSVAGSVLVAQYYGAKKMQEVEKVMGQTVLISLVFSFCLGIFGFFIVPFILQAIGVESSVYEIAKFFMQTTMIGIVPVFSFIMFQSLMRGIGKTTIPLLIVIGTVILNFALDPLFIYGYGIIPGYGAAGAAIATLITQALASILGGFLLIRWTMGISLKKEYLSFDLPLFKRIVKLGTPSSLEQSIRALSITAMTILATKFGTNIVAAYGVGSNVIQFIMIPAFGFGMALSTLVGQNIGAGKFDVARKTVQVGVVTAFTALLILGALISLFSSKIILFFLPAASPASPYAIDLVSTIGWSFCLIGIQHSLNGAFRASGRTIVPMTISLIWIGQIGIALILSTVLGFREKGIWWSFPLMNLVSATVLSIWYIKNGSQFRQLTREEKKQESLSEEILIEEGVRS